MKKKEKIIITGISGQDASYLIDELKSQYEIIGLSRIKKKKIIVRNTYKIIHTDKKFQKFITTI